MPAIFDTDRFHSAAARFREFFNELGDAFIEREDVMRQFQLALLSREHVLMTGPPGTAKSQMAAAVLRRIIDENTGEPSVFARQFTENTVQTDLVGAIDFKTLMESGRTEHFTDEGILGAVHAFLDEVFDGRDMLLRSTLNLLHERELKQGTSTTRGRIESAFMTSNRYIAEILEGARETLLAFLDRIAFISFVPRGFADAKNFALVVRRHGGGFGRHRLSAPLSIQDIDVLQHAVELTFVPEVICDGLARLLRDLDAEQAAAMRADREFQPTRYLSTRTAVRAATVLRAAAVRDVIFGRVRPHFMVQWDDLSALRYHLILAGLSRERAAALMEHETDPRERRQLGIMRTEAEIFERCLARVSRTALPETPPTVDMGSLEAMLSQARNSGDPKALVRAAHALAHASESGVVGADQATRLLTHTVGVLSEHALSTGLAPVLDDDRDIIDIARDMAAIADDLERALDASRPLARWVRGRLLGLIDESLKLASTVTSSSVDLLLGQPSRSALQSQIDQRLQAAEALFRLRRQLEVGGAWTEDRDTSNASWRMAMSRLEQELGLLWDARFRLATCDLLASAQGPRPLSQVLAELVPHLATLDKDVERISALGTPSELFKRVVKPRIEPLVEAALGNMSVSRRQAAIDEIAAVVRELERVALGELIDPERFVGWAAPALVRAERARQQAAEQEAAGEGPGESGGQAVVRDHAGYVRACAADDPLSLVQTLVEITLRVVPHSAFEPEHPELATHAVWRVVRGIRADLKHDVAELDLARVERGLGHLQGWWAELSSGREDARSEPARAVGLLEQAVQTGFLRVMRGQAPLRLALEAKNLSEVFPEYADRANGLRKQLRGLDRNSTGLMVELLEQHSERAWASALGTPGSGPSGGAQAKPSGNPGGSKP